MHRSAIARIGLPALLLVNIVASRAVPVVNFSSAGATHIPLIQAGDPAGSPVDSPISRVDANLSSSLFSGVGSIFTTDGISGFLGSGTPISRYHILTAAHLVDTDNNGTVDILPGDAQFVLNYNGDYSHVIASSQIAIHPEYTGFNNPTVNDDLAILTLSSPLPLEIPIYPLLPSGNLSAHQLTLAGYGASGDGLAGYTINGAFNVKRSGQNMLEAVATNDDPSGTDAEVFYYDFENSADVPGTDFFGFSGALGNDIESMVGPGDSGGPAFVMYNSSLHLAGVNTFAIAFEGAAPGSFGSLGGGIWLESYLPWIAQSTQVPEGGALFAFAATFAGLSLARKRARH